MTPRNLIEAALRAKSYINPGNVDVGSCQFEWRRLPEPLSRMPSCAAVDGGSRRIDLEARTIFAVKAWGGVFNPKLSLEKPAAYIGPIIPPRYIDERIGMYREILEAYVALNVIPENGVLLIDGSIRPVIRWWRPGFVEGRLKLRDALKEAEKSLEEWAAKGYGDVADSIRGCLSKELGSPTCVEELARKSSVRPGSVEYAQQLARHGKESSGDWIALLEVIEKLYLYMEVIKGSWRLGATPIFITKTSRQTGMCRSLHPDVHYIKKLRPWEPGYTIWKESVRIGAYEIANIPRESLSSSLYPDIAGIRRFYEEDLALVEAYARLQKSQPILLVGVAIPSYKVDKDPLVAEDVVEKVISTLLSIPGNGYPTPLFIAHHKAKIDGREIDAVKRILGLELEASERVLLEF